MSIRWIAWDLGGVLTTWDSRRHWRWAAKRYGIPVAAAAAAVEWREKDLGSGRLPYKEYWAHCQRCFKTADPLSVNVAIHVAFQQPRTSTLRIARALKPRYKMALATNIFPGHLARIRHKVPFPKLMDVVVASDRIGAWKPERKFWRILCSRTGANPGEIVFIDDSAKNCRGARAFGLKAVHFTTAARLRKDLRKLGVR